MSKDTSKPPALPPSLPKSDSRSSGMEPAKLPPSLPPTLPPSFAKLETESKAHTNGEVSTKSEESSRLGVDDQAEVKDASKPSSDEKAKDEKIEAKESEAKPVEAKDAPVAAEKSDSDKKAEETKPAAEVAEKKPETTSEPSAPKPDKYLSEISTTAGGAAKTSEPEKPVTKTETTTPEKAKEAEPAKDEKKTEEVAKSDEKKAESAKVEEKKSEAAKVDEKKAEPAKSEVAKADSEMAAKDKGEAKTDDAKAKADAKDKADSDPKSAIVKAGEKSGQLVVMEKAKDKVVLSKPAVTLIEEPEWEDEFEDSEVLIRTEGLVKKYGGRTVVNGVDINIRAGEVVGLLGPNGAGKTTTFYMIVGLIPPTAGHVFLGDENVSAMPMYRRARRGIGYLPQEESIFRKLTVEENLLAILETLPISHKERLQKCEDLLLDFGLDHVRKNIALTLSGGEKRRVTIARALVTNPTALLLDEPFSGVDPMAVFDIQQIILTLRERGIGVLITDHNVRDTLSVVDRAYLICEGKVEREGTSEFLINDPVARELYLGPRFSM